MTFIPHELLQTNFIRYELLLTNFCSWAVSPTNLMFMNFGPGSVMQTLPGQVALASTQLRRRRRRCRRRTAFAIHSEISGTCCMHACLQGLRKGVCMVCSCTPWKSCGCAKRLFCTHPQLKATRKRAAETGSDLRVYQPAERPTTYTVETCTFGFPCLGKWSPTWVVFRAGDTFDEEPILLTRVS